MSQLFLGIDGGATKTKAVLIDGDKNVIDRDQTGGSNADSLGFLKAFANIEEVIFKVAGKNTSLIATFAISGINTEKDAEMWEDAFARHPNLPKLFKVPPTFTNDIVCSLRSGTEDKNAIAIISGTGSSCWGKNEHGEEAKSGGRDYILADEGSAYFLGDKILRAVTKSLDGRGDKTVLSALLFDKYQISSLTDLTDLIYHKPWDKTDIAQVAQIIEKAVKSKDEIAIKILKDAANELSIMAKAVATRLKIIDKPYTIVKTGSVFRIKEIFNQELEKQIHKFSPKAQLVFPEIDGATAAAYLALESK